MKVVTIFLIICLAQTFAESPEDDYDAVEYTKCLEEYDLLKIKDQAEKDRTYDHDRACWNFCLSVSSRYVSRDGTILVKESLQKSPKGISALESIENCKKESNGDKCKATQCFFDKHPEYLI